MLKFVWHLKIGLKVIKLFYYYFFFGHVTEVWSKAFHPSLMFVDGATTNSITTLRMKTLSTTTLNIKTLSTTMVSITLNVHNDAQHNGTWNRVLLWWVLFMLSVTNKPCLLSVVMLNVIMRSVVALRRSLELTRLIVSRSIVVQFYCKMLHYATFFK